MSLKFGGISNDLVVANFVLNLAVQEVSKNRLIFHEVIDMSGVSCFLTHLVLPAN